jgi:hypothetical protein
MESKEQLLFTPAALLDLLTSIDELKTFPIGISEDLDGSLQLTIGNSLYTIDDSDAKTIVVSQQVADTVVDTNQTAYTDLVEHNPEDLEDASNEPVPVKAGLIKELAKSLLLGGLIRLAGKLVK